MCSYFACWKAWSKLIKHSRACGVQNLLFLYRENHYLVLQCRLLRDQHSATDQLDKGPKKCCGDEESRMKWEQFLLFENQTKCAFNSHHSHSRVDRISYLLWLHLCCPCRENRKTKWRAVRVEGLRKHKPIKIFIFLLKCNSFIEWISLLSWSGCCNIV